MPTLGPDLAPVLSTLPDRMSHVIAPWAVESPHAMAMIQGERSLSYAQLAQAINGAGQWLKARGARGGDRVMVLGENSLELAVLVLAIGDIDAWPLVVNARISEREVRAIAAHSTARLLVCTVGTSTEAAAQARALDLVPDHLPGLGAVAVSAVPADTPSEPVSTAGAQQVGALLYTSGTTGTPKGVMLSHRNVLFTAATGGALRAMTPADIVYGVLPMSHIVGFSILATALMHGACLELVPRFDAQSTLEALRSGCVSWLQGVPAMYQRILAFANGKVDGPRLRLIAVAGAPLDLTLKRETESAFGLTLQNGYGITECAPTISFTRSEDPREDTTVGPPVPGIEVRLVSPGGTPVARGEVGELHVKGPNVMLGYYRSPEQTAAVLSPDGWFNTGDLARLEGPFLHIAGRTKELIIRSGFNVYPPEVEAVLATHPAVAACAVVGRAVPGNEEVVAFVQLRAGADATSEDIAAHAAQLLAPYKRPSQILIRESLPVTTAGKILKHELAKQASGRTA